jgi:hypothetical protein
LPSHLRREQPQARIELLLGFVIALLAAALISAAELAIVYLNTSP